MFVKHVPKGHIWFVYGYKGQELKREEFLGKRTERALRTILGYKRKNKDVPVFIYYEDDRFEYSPVTVKELISMKVLVDNTCGDYTTQELPKRMLNDNEHFHCFKPEKAPEPKTGFKDDKLPTRAELRAKQGL